MRGQRTFNLLFPELPEGEPEEKVKGRSAELHGERNEWICARFYYYKVFTVYRYDLILSILKREFKVSESTLSQIIQLSECEVYLKKLQNKNPDIDFFRSEWYWMVWEAAQPLSRKGKELAGKKKKAR